MITDKAKRKVALFIKDMFNKANVGGGGNATFPNSNELDSPILEYSTICFLTQCKILSIYCIWLNTFSIFIKVLLY